MKGHEEFSRIMKIFYILMWVWATQVYTFVNHQIVHLISVQFTICKFNFKRNNFKQILNPT